MQQIDEIAVFVDIENLIGFCHELRLPIDLTDVLAKLKEGGRITVRRSFGDIAKALAATNQLRELEHVRRMLRDNLFQHEDIPYTNNFKNSADMRLAIEALSTAFTLPNIGKFAIISGDSDYIPLFRKLQEQSRSVIGITGSEQRTAVVYRSACDSLFYFNDIFRANVTETIEELPTSEKNPAIKVIKKQAAAPGLEGQPVAGKPPAAAVSEAPSVIFDPQTLRDEYANLLGRAVRLSEQTGNPTTARNVFQKMRQLQADFDYERAGFSSFPELIKFAEDRGLVSVNRKGEDLFLFQPLKSNDPGLVVSTAQYRKRLQDRLKCQLPAFQMRKAICEESFRIIGHEAEGALLLQDWAQDTAEEMSNNNLNISQSEVFKYLYSLFRARCFTVQLNALSDYNPLVTGFMAQVDDWDDRFVSLQLRSLSHQDQTLKFYPSRLSLLFYETESQSLHIKKLLKAQDITAEAEIIKFLSESPGLII